MLVCVISVSDVTVSLSVVSELLMSSVSSVTCVLSAFLMSHFVLLNSIPEGIVKSCLCIHMCAILNPGAILNPVNVVCVGLVCNVTASCSVLSGFLRTFVVDWTGLRALRPVTMHHVTYCSTDDLSSKWLQRTSCDS